MEQPHALIRVAGLVRVPPSDVRRGRARSAYIAGVALRHEHARDLFQAAVRDRETPAVPASFYRADGGRLALLHTWMTNSDLRIVLAHPDYLNDAPPLAYCNGARRRHR